MVNYSIPNWTGNYGGIEVLLAEGTRQYQGFATGILFFIYLVIGLGGFLSQDKKSAGNLLGSFSVAGLITTTLSFILFLYDNIINIESVIIFMTITICIALGFLTTARD